MVNLGTLKCFADVGLQSESSDSREEDAKLLGLYPRVRYIPV
jgi:hypothetical protein